jgi:hypothetical protein
MTRDEYDSIMLAEIPQTIQFLLEKGAPRHIADPVARDAWHRGFEYHTEIARERLVGWINAIAKDRLRSARSGGGSRLKMST